MRRSNMRFQQKMKKVNLLFLLKTGIGSAAAILIASSLGFLYSPSAGIITLLTIQNTKKETITIAFRRFIAFISATLITYIVFTLFGYSPAAFGAIVFLFVAVCMLAGLKDGIAMNAVLMTHFLIEKHMDLPLILNELGILAIGMVIGIILNLIMPSRKQKIRKEQLLLEEEMKAALCKMAELLSKKEACLIQETESDTSEPSLEQIVAVDIVDFKVLDITLEELLKRAYEEAGNTLLSDTRYLVSYLEMRKLQLDVLKSITNNIKNIPVVLQQTYPIADFMEHIAASFHELNNAIGLLAELEDLKEHYRREKLPQTREEFEYRATLFQIMKELEYFLLLKRNFVLELERKNMRAYWK
jgi:uncharacterized membrane protein YgaE (UPF0421/DUF939 family)